MEIACDWYVLSKTWNSRNAHDIDSKFVIHNSKFAIRNLSLNIIIPNLVGAALDEKFETHIRTRIKSKARINSECANKQTKKTKIRKMNFGARIFESCRKRSDRIRCLESSANFWSRFEYNKLRVWVKFGTVECILEMSYKSIEIKKMQKNGNSNLIRNYIEEFSWNLRRFENK
jgi:hypothetical protein